MQNKLPRPHAMCHCEHELCHPNGNCENKATCIVLTFGIRQFLCNNCMIHETSVVLENPKEWKD